MDGLAELINEEEAVYGLAYEGRESLVGKIIKHRWQVRVVWSNGTLLKC